jgi:hypothetical protein
MILFYHIADLPNWKPLVEEKIQLMKNKNLWQSFNTIFLLCHYNRNSFTPWLNQFKTDNRINTILYTDSQNPLGEIYSNITIKEICDDLKNNTKIFRYHTKGLSQLYTDNKQIALDWNKYIDYYNIIQWKNTITHLDNYDTVGVNVHQPIHYSGNIYWANSDYIKTLPQFPKPHNNNYKKLIPESYSLRHDSELWIGLNNPNYKELHHYQHANVYNVIPPQIKVYNKYITFTTSEENN